MGCFCQEGSVPRVVLSRYSTVPASHPRKDPGSGRRNLMTGEGRRWDSKFSGVVTPTRSCAQVKTRLSGRTVGVRRHRKPNLLPRTKHVVLVSMEGLKHWKRDTNENRRRRPSSTSTSRTDIYLPGIRVWGPDGTTTPLETGEGWDFQGSYRQESTPSTPRTTPE